MALKGYGEILKKARETKKLTHLELHKILKMDPSYLKALEEENIKPFEKNVYMRLFLKTYARHLKLNVEELLALFDYSPEVQLPDKKLKEKSQQKILVGDFVKESETNKFEAAKGLDLTILTQKNILIIGSAVAGLIVIIAFIMIFAGKGKPGVSANNNIYVATVNAPTNLKISVRAKEDVWMKSRVDGNEEDFMLKRGEEKKWKDTNKVVFLVGNAGGVEFTVNGDAIGVIGESGEVINGLVFETGKNWYIDKALGFKRENQKPAAEAPTAIQAATPSGATTTAQ